MADDGKEVFIRRFMFLESDYQKRAVVRLHHQVTVTVVQQHRVCKHGVGLLYMSFATSVRVRKIIPKLFLVCFFFDDRTFVTVCIRDFYFSEEIHRTC